MAKGKPPMATDTPKDPQDVGYTLPTILAVAVHLAIIVFSLINWPSSSAEPDSSSIVQATLVSTETFTDQAQQVTEQQAAMNTAAEPATPEASEPEAAAPEPDTQAAEQQAAEEAARREAQAAAEALAEAQAAAEADAQRRAEEAERIAQEQAAQAEAREAEAQAQREREAEAQRQREAEEQREREAAAQREREAEAQRQREAEAERQRQAAAEAAEAAMQRQLAGEAEAAANAQQAQQAANSFINIVRRAVEQAWLIPPGASDSLSATLQIRLGPSGELLAASIATSSGDSAFDRSAIQAVEQAAPFGELRDLPADQQRNLRQINLRFTPGDVR